MIQIELQNVAWGTNDVSTPDVNARRINLKDADSGIVVTVPFGGDALAKLAGELAESMTPEQKRTLAGQLTGGLVLPGSNGFDKGPQG